MAAAVSEQWTVEYSRFFPYPRPSASPPAGLRPLPKCKILHSRGTWISSSSAAVLLLRKPNAASVPILSVSLCGKIYEEHFVSNLHFSWPQVSCVAECPIRGSRVVFLSYRDASSQIQKFAVRFPKHSDAEAFLIFVKECSRDTMDMAPPGSDFVCEDSSPSDYIASNGLHHRFDDEASYEEPITAYAPEVPALTFNNDDREAPLQPLLASSVENIFSGFPPSFTDLLTNCTSDSQKGYAEQMQPMKETDLRSQNRGYVQDPSPPSHRMYLTLNACANHAKILLEDTHLLLWWSCFHFLSLGLQMQLLPMNRLLWMMMIFSRPKLRNTCRILLFMICCSN